MGLELWKNSEGCAEAEERKEGFREDKSRWRESMSGALGNCLKNEYILHSGAVSNEGKEFFEESALSPEEQRLFARYLEKNSLFRRLWNGPTAIDITLRAQVRVENGIIYYNDRKYNKDTWTNFLVVEGLLYGPPKFIRLQGRLAKESPDPLNSIPTDVVELEDGQYQRVRRTCGCGGRLIYDHNSILYCEKCYYIDDR
jgi:ribosomal protein S27AE